MRILVVDDEPIMLESISRILETETNIQLETARSGREAIEKAVSFRPELIMMDIKMPGINGLEAINEIRRIDPQVITVILSAYDNFVYAQEAIRHGVDDYLIKPVNKTRILETVGQAKRQLEERRNSRQEELKIRERYKKSLPLIENEFIHTVVNGMDEYALQDYQELLGMNFSSGFFAAISFLPEYPPLESEIEPKYSFLEKVARLAEEIHHLFPCLIGVRTNPMIVFIPSTPSGPADLDSAADIAVRRLYERIKLENLGVKYQIGVGTIVSSASDYRRSYTEALQTIHSNNQAICRFKDLNPAENPWEGLFESKMADLLEAIRFGHSKRVQVLTADLMSEIILRYPAEKDRLFCNLLELLLSSYRIGKTIIKNNLQAPGYLELISLLTPEDNIREITTAVTARILDITQQVHTDIEIHTKSIIRQAKQFIEEHYTTELSLEELSRAVAVSPYYLCRLFREELGCSFTEFLTKIRLEKALTLLAQGLSVKECSFTVGYNDPNYFSRIFRKYYQITPTEYRDTQLSSKEAPSHE